MSTQADAPTESPSYGGLSGEQSQSVRSKERKFSICAVTATKAPPAAVAQNKRFQDLLEFLKGAFPNKDSRVLTEIAKTYYNAELKDITKILQNIMDDEEEMNSSDEEEEVHIDCMVVSDGFTKNQGGQRRRGNHRTFRRSVSDQFDPSDLADVHTRVAEGVFLRMMNRNPVNGGGIANASDVIEYVTYVTNKTLEDRFNREKRVRTFLDQHCLQQHRKFICNNSSLRRFWVSFLSAFFSTTATRLRSSPTFSSLTFPLTPEA
jgi:hypothetical protein